MNILTIPNFVVEHTHAGNDISIMAGTGVILNIYPNKTQPTTKYVSCENLEEFQPYFNDLNMP